MGSSDPDLRGARGFLNCFPRGEKRPSAAGRFCGRHSNPQCAPAMLGAARAVLRPNACSSSLLARHVAVSRPLVAAAPAAVQLMFFGTAAQDAHAAKIAAKRATWPHVDSGWGPTASVFGRVTVGVLFFGGVGTAAWQIDRSRQKKQGGDTKDQVMILERMAPEVYAALVGWGVVGAGLIGVSLALKLGHRVGQRIIDGPTALQRYATSLSDPNGARAANQTSLGRIFLGVSSSIVLISAAWFADGRADDGGGAASTDAPAAPIAAAGAPAAASAPVAAAGEKR